MFLQICSKAVRRKEDEGEEEEEEEEEEQQEQEQQQQQQQHKGSRRDVIRRLASLKAPVAFLLAELPQPLRSCIFCCKSKSTIEPMFNAARQVLLSSGSSSTTVTVRSCRGGATTLIIGWLKSTPTRNRFEDA